MEVALRKVTRRFGKAVAVNGIDLSISGGEFLSIVGPSGCGKTTILRLIAGFLQPDEGEILFDGNIVNHLPPRKRQVGIVFQNYALFPNLSVFENIAFGLRARKLPNREITERVQEMLQLVRLEGKAESYPAQLSGGQQQRVALARALAIAPRVLLLDEPLSALDAKVRLMIRYEIKRIQQEAGITTLYVTHDQEEALSISDRVAVMNQGTFLQVGTPEEIYREPHNEFVASFIGIANLLRGEAVTPEKGEIRWKGLTIRVPPFPPAKREVLVMIRPEKIQVIPEGQKPAETTWMLLPGIVEGKVFLGPLIRLAVRVQDEPILVDVADWERYRFQGGERVYLGFAPEAVRIL